MDKEQKILLTNKDCVHCNAAKKKHAAEISNGSIKTVDISKSIPKELIPAIQALDIQAVPQLFSVTEKDNGTTVVCDLETNQCKTIKNE